MKILALIFLLGSSVGLLAQTNVPPFPWQMLPVPAAVAPANRVFAPVKYVVQTNVVNVCWQPYTNVCFEIIGCTNLAQSADSNQWFHVAYVPIWATNVYIQATNGSEFFKARTMQIP